MGSDYDHQYSRLGTKSPLLTTTDDRVVDDAGSTRHTSPPTVHAGPNQKPATERGASLVEFALVAPLLFVLLFGMIEFGWLFGQFNEVRHAAREGARYAAVSRPDLDGGGAGNSDVVKAVCDSINLPGATVLVSLSGGTDRLDYATLTVDADVGSLSGAPLITSFLPNNLSNSATFRLEQDAGWTGFSNQPCP
jgi:hypothetical protein